MNPTLWEAGIKVGDRIGLTHNAPACNRGATVSAVYEREGTLQATCECGRRFCLSLSGRYPIKSRADGGGWIVYGDAGLIWGLGATESEARDDAERSAAVAGCALDWDTLWTYRATARLLDAVRVGGGGVLWHSVTIDGCWHADVRT